MASTFSKKPFSTMYMYTRPTIGTYESVSGELQEAPPNRIRLDHKDGVLWGIKFGDRDYMRIPLLDNNKTWPTHDGTGTFVITGNAPDGYQFLSCGGFGEVGYGTLKTTVRKVDSSDLDPIIEMFRDSPDFNDGEEGHILIVKYYQEDIDFESYEEFVAMEELNSFMHAAWN